MTTIVRADAESLIQLKTGLTTSGYKYSSEASLLRAAISALEASSDTNAFAGVVENALDIAQRIEAVGLAIDAVADSLTTEIERLTALTDLTRRA